MTAEDIERAVRALDEGAVVLIPTDTVYGIAARPDRPPALAKIFEVKGRPRDKPLPVLAASADDLQGIAMLDRRALRLAARFWPGPLTIVVCRAAGFTADLGGAPTGTLGVRVPDCPTALALLRAAGPLAVTSANRSGEPPAATVDEAHRALGHSIAVSVNAGPRNGVPSTIVSLAGTPRVLRRGSLAPAEVLTAIE